MKYRTTIEIISEAADKNEAADIAGEYLSGNLISGVSMKCRTATVSSYRQAVAGLAVVLLVVATGIFSALQPRQNQIAVSAMPGYGASAMQPPLKTANDAKNREFKKEWQKKQDKAAIDLIKSVR